MYSIVLPKAFGSFNVKSEPVTKLAESIKTALMQSLLFIAGVSFWTFKIQSVETENQILAYKIDILINFIDFSVIPFSI